MNNWYKMNFYAFAAIGRKLKLGLQRNDGDLHLFQLAVAIYSS